LRKYLNSEFLDKLDGSKIESVVNKNIGNLWYGTRGGGDTQDQIFLLSLEEVDAYFGNSGDYLRRIRKDRSTKGKIYEDEDGWLISNEHDSNRTAKYEGDFLWWWLRSPGNVRNRTACVLRDGRVDVIGDEVICNNIGYGGVRPALWLKL
jgi:hypothetical protein